MESDPQYDEWSELVFTWIEAIYHVRYISPQISRGALAAWDREQDIWYGNT